MQGSAVQQDEGRESGRSNEYVPVPNENFPAYIPGPQGYSYQSAMGMSGSYVYNFVIFYFIYLVNFVKFWVCFEFLGFLIFNSFVLSWSAIC